MNSTTATVALVRDTFREAFARKVFWGFYGLSTLMIVFFLFVMKIDIVEGAMATVSLFGQQAGRMQDVDKLVKGALGAIAAFLYTWGLAIAIFASASLVPSMLEPGRIELLLSKPVSRVNILMGRFLGILLVVAVNIVYLVLGVWLIIGWKTHQWPLEFLLSAAGSIFLFTAFLCLITLIGVVTDSVALSVMIPIALMMLSPILAQEKVAVKLLSAEWARWVWKALYQMLPKVYDIGKITLEMVRGREGSFDFLALYTTAIFACVTLVASLWVFQKRDF